MLNLKATISEYGCTEDLSGSIYPLYFVGFSFIL